MDIEFSGRAGVRRALRVALALTTAGICVSLAACQTVRGSAADGTFIGSLGVAPKVDGPFVVVAVDGASGDIVHRVFLGKERRFELNVPARQIQVVCLRRRGSQRAQRRRRGDERDVRGVDAIARERSHRVAGARNRRGAGCAQRAMSAPRDAQRRTTASMAWPIASTR